jgi:uncharacterized protein (DUF1015 family)
LKIKAFKPLVYTGEISDFVSPPFDTILKEQEEDLKANKYNITKLTLPDPGSDPSSLINEWIRGGMLKLMPNDVILLVLQEFSYAGQNFQRIGIICLTSVYPIDGSVKPHERTFEGPKKGRMQLMASLKCEPEPIFLLVSNTRFDKLIKSAVKDSRKLFSFEEPLNVVNKIYAIEDDQIILDIRKSLETENSIVADGHHRLAATQSLAELSEGQWRDFWSYSLSYITSVHDPGLLISGIHRIVKSREYNREWLEACKQYFEIETADSLSRFQGIVMYDGKYHYFRRRENYLDQELEGEIIDGFIPENDILNKIILKKCMRMDENSLENGLVYTNELSEAIKEVNEGKASMSFIMPPWDKDIFIKIVMKGITLPQKSTFFYPKIPSGIALNYPEFIYKES